MRKIFYIAAAACIFAASCQKDEPSTLVNGEKATLVVNLENELTRASSAATSLESSIDASKVFLFVFKADGSREYGQAVTLADRSVSVNLTAGAKTVWVVVNCPDTILDAATYAAFKTKVSALTDNTSKFVMAGSASKTINGNDAVSVVLKRLASKVCLVSLKREFTDPDYASSTLMINRVYLSNVSGICHYYSDGSTSTAVAPESVTTWYNKLGAYSLSGSDPASLLAVNVGTTLSDGSTYATEQVLYAYPNVCTADNYGDTWDMSTYPRHTRLVIDCSLAGAQGYYNVSLPVMDSNKIYNISLTVHKKPSSSPEDNGGEINPALAFSVSISVADWDTPITVTETL